MDVLVRRVYLGGAYKSDHELMILCPKKALTVALQMHFNGDDDDRFELLKRLREQSLNDPQCLVPTYLLAAPVSFLSEIASQSQKKKKTRKRERESCSISDKNVKRIQHSSARWLDSVPSQDYCEKAARLLQQWSSEFSTEEEKERSNEETSINDEVDSSE